MASPISRNQPKGHAKPRIAPPAPVRSRVAELVTVAREIGIEFIPWQYTTGRYLEAVGPDDHWLYPEACAVVARQNGKTEFLVPHIVRRLRMGRRIMHTAQNRELPREVFGRVADILAQDMTLFRERNGRPLRPRFANGQEELRLSNGGTYKIVAPTRGGARGPSNDDVIVDEVRELDSFEFIGAAEPTMAASPNPQILYLSSAGEETSVVLNSLRLRADEDPSLAYLEWSARPDRTANDRTGWSESNPSIGYLPGILPYLERKYVSHQLAGTMALFENENLTRWVVTTRERLVDEYAWAQCHQADLEAASRPVMGISMDPLGKRASAAVAWRRPNDTTGLQLLFDVPGDPINVDELGKDLRQVASRLGVTKVGFDPLTDAELAKYFAKTEAISAAKYANASSQFVNLVNGGKLRWNDADPLTDDLTWTARKANAERGSFEAVRAKDDRPITAALAAIRAVGLASGPLPPSPRIY